LHPDARSLWAEWATESARLARSSRGLAAAFAAKLPVQVARIALVLHCLWHPDDPARPVSRERLADAIELGEYFRQHANRVLAHFDGSGAPGAAALVARVERALARGGDEWVSKTDLHRRLGNSVEAAALDGALAALLTAGRAERRTVPTQTKPIEQWRRIATGESSYEDFQ
jgi:hypothetical protein